MNRRYFDDYMDMRNMNTCYACPFMGMSQGMYPCEMMNMTAPAPPCTMENIMQMNQPQNMYNMMQQYAPMCPNQMMQQGTMMQQSPIGSQDGSIPYNLINPYELRIKTVNIEDVTD